MWFSEVVGFAAPVMARRRMSRWIIGNKPTRHDWNRLFRRTLHSKYWWPFKPVVEVMPRDRRQKTTMCHIGIRMSMSWTFLDEFLRLNKAVNSERWLLIAGGRSQKGGSFVSLDARLIGDPLPKDVFSVTALTCNVRIPKQSASSMELDQSPSGVREDHRFSGFEASTNLVMPTE